MLFSLAACGENTPDPSKTTPQTPTTEENNSPSDSKDDNQDEQPDVEDKDDNKDSGEDNKGDNGNGGNTDDKQQGEQSGQDSDGDTDGDNELINAYQDIVDALKTRLAEINKTDRDLIEIISIYIDNGRFACVAKNNNENGATYAYRFSTIHADNIDEITSEEILEANKSLFKIVGRNYNKGVETYETNPELLEAMTKKLVGEDYEIIVAGLTEPNNWQNLEYYIFDFYALLKNKHTKQIFTFETDVDVAVTDVITYQANVPGGNVYDIVVNTDKYEKGKEVPVVLNGSEVYEIECERVEEAKKAAENK